MRKYEFMFIVNPSLDEASIKNVANEMKNIITKSDAKIIDEKDMGQKDLAYEINKHKKGYYFLYVIEASTEVMAEINRLANVNENVIRHLIVKVEE